mmetsp:Transcript_34256/g.49767  ORF Transcript_34256/g.49767 Transcript_34256/m.49767 type:complete len:218 (-) Transcript_34256:1103-1756(-)
MMISMVVVMIGSVLSLRRGVIVQSWQNNLHRTSTLTGSRSGITIARFRNTVLPGCSSTASCARRSMHAQWQYPSSHSTHRAGGRGRARISRVRIRVRIRHVTLDVRRCALILADGVRVISIACYADTAILIIGSRCAACASRGSASTAGVFVHVSFAKISFRDRGLTIRTVAEFDSRASTSGVAADQLGSMFHVFGDAEMCGLGIVSHRHSACSAGD